jgi:quercetin dioxygenase-like cupin family protein
MLIPPDTAHGVEALEESIVLDFFSPAREDWQSGADNYLRR